MSRKIETQQLKTENPLAGRVGLVYARVSSKRQELEGHGRESQEGRCRQDLESVGVPFGKTFPDTYTGGGDFMNRPAMRELLAYIDAHPHKKFVVVFDDLKRFARDTAFHLKLRSAFKARDAMPRCLNYNFDDSPEGMFVETVLAAGNELERHQNRRQVIQKMKARLDAGYWPFSRKKGYDLIKDPIHGKLGCPNKEGLEILKPAIEAFATGNLLRKIDIAKFLVERGFWKKNRSPEKYIHIVDAILRDPFYCGDIEYLKWDVQKRKGHHEGIISHDTFSLIQMRLKKAVSRARVRMDISSDFPLRGLLVCSRCSKHLTGAWSKKHSYAHYFCQNSECALRNKTLRKKDVEDDFRTLLKRNHLKAEVRGLMIVAFDRLWKQEVGALEQQEHRVSGHRAALKEKIRGLAELARKTTSEAVQKAYEEQIEETSVELEGLAYPVAENDLSVPYRTALTKSVGLLKSPYSVWESVDAAEKQRLFYFLFEAKLPYTKNEGYRTGDSLSTTRLFEELMVEKSLSVDPARIELAPVQCECTVLPLN